MASEKVVFEGIALYANVPPRPAKKGYETEDTSYSILVECTKERLKELKAKGAPALTQVKTYPEDFVSKDGKAPADLPEANGKSFIRVKATKTKGELVFKDIPVVDEYGDILDSNIGNGSKVVVVASLDPIKGRPGKALRLKGVQVVDLVEYNDAETSVFAGVAEFKSKPKSSMANDVPFDTDDNDDGGLFS